LAIPALPGRSPRCYVISEYLSYADVLGLHDARTLSPFLETASMLPYA